MEKQKLIYVESKAKFSPSEVSDKAIVFIEDTKEIWTHGVYFSCSGTWASPITLSLTGDTTGSVSIDGSGNASIATTTRYLSGMSSSSSDCNSAATTLPGNVTYYPCILNSATNKFPTSNNANGILSLNVHDYSYTHLLGFSSNGNIYHRRRNGGTWETSWREILTSTNYTKYPHTFASLTNKPTTISGYGITDSIPIIKGGLVTTDTDLSTLGMTTAGAKLSVFHLYTGPYPSWLNVPYMNVLMFRSTSDSYGAIGIEMIGGHTVQFVGGRNAETSTNNAPNWWYRIKGNSGATYDLNSFLNTINNLDGNYLRKSGGTMTGNIILTTNSSSIYDSTSSYGLLGANLAGNSTTGLFSEKGVYVGKPDSLTTIRSSGNDLWHYTNANLARYLILDANNYTNYTIPYSKSNVNNGAIGAFIYNGGLLYNTNFVYRQFYNATSTGGLAYLLFAKLVNYKNSDSSLAWTPYGISGVMMAQRNGAVTYTGCFNIAAWANVGPNNNVYTRLSISHMGEPNTYYTILPVIVLYEGEYYLALETRGSTTTILFYGITSNLSSSFINIQDASLVTVVKTPEDTTSTHLYYYNAGTPKKYLHEGNYQNYYPLKLQNARTLWGQSFDGSADVNGCINIIRDSSFTNNYNEGIRIQGASNLWCGIFLGTDGTTLGYTSTQWNISKTAVDSLRISRGATSNNILDILYTGNVGIGTISPSEKLEVNGNAIIGNSSSNHSLTIKSQNSAGVATLYFDNGVYETDLPWKGYIAVSGYGDTSMRVGTGLNGNLLCIHGMIFKLPRDIWGYSFRNNANNDIAYLSYLGKLTTKLGYVVENGTSSQFLKADGSLDSSNYYKIGTELPIYRNVHVRDQSTNSGIFGVVNSGSDLVGGSDLATVYSGTTNLPYILRTSADNLYHYNANKASRYLIIDTNNYSNYTVKYSSSKVMAGTMPVLSDGGLFLHNSLKFLYFYPSDNGGAISYLLIAELPNYDAGTNTSYIVYGIVGTMTASRSGNAANSHAHHITAVASIGPGTNTKIYTSAITDSLVPMIVKYNSKYYIALQKTSSSAGHYFMGLAANLLSSYIQVNDSSLIEIIKRPTAEISTSNKYYNGGDPKYYLHEGNYSDYALPLSGGTLTGTLTSSNITPRASVTYDIGTTSAYYNNIYALYFKRKDSSDSYVLLGGGGHKLLSELSGTHTHPWTDITEVPKILPGIAKAWFVPGHAFCSDLNAYISTINNRLYSADARYTVTTSNISNPIHFLFNNNYDNHCIIAAGTTGTITIEGFNWVYPYGVIFISFYHTSRPESAKVTITYNSGNNTMTIGRSPIEPNGVWAFQIGVNYLTKIEIQLTAPSDKALWVTLIEYSVTRTDDTLRDTAIVTNYNANTLLYQLTAPKYIVKNGTSSQFLKADGSLDSTSYLPTAGGTLGSSTSSFTDFFIKSSTAKLRLASFTDSTTYIQSGNSDFTGNATLKITGYNNTTGSNLYFNFANIYCRGSNYTNIDSGNYSSYALPLSGGTLTGTLISRDIRPSANLSYSLGTSSYYYNYVYAKYFKKNGSSDSYVLLGGGGHKAVSDFPIKELKKTTSISGNTDQWSIILEQSYPAGYWYDVINTFLVEGVLFGSGFLSFYAYWNTSSSAFNDYITEVYFNGVMRGEAASTFGGSNRDINDYLRIYIDKTNYKLLVYANHYNGKTVRIKRINYNEIETSGFPNGGILVEHFNDKGTIVSLPTESTKMTRVLIKTHYNHDRTIKTSKSIYASSFYENSDIRLKENIRRIDLSDLTKLVDLVQFNFKDSDTKKYGVIAQLLELVGLQNLVYENDGKKAVDYISLLVLEIQRLRNEIGELKLEINKKS